MWTPAIEEFNAFTRENPDIGRGWYNLGWAQLHSGQHAEAADAFARAGELGFNPATSSYNAACAHALSGQSGAALDWLERAVDEGFSSFGHIATDGDLESLHGNPRFEKILEDGGWDEEQALKMKMKMKMKKEHEIQKKLEFRDEKSIQGYVKVQVNDHPYWEGPNLVMNEGLAYGAKLLAGLNHANIGGIYGTEHQEGRHILVLEYVEGDDLQQRLEGRFRRLGPQRAQRPCRRRVCSGHRRPPVFPRRDRARGRGAESPAESARPHHGCHG